MECNEFSYFIEKNAHESKISNFDFILKYCEENYIDVDDIIHLLNPNMFIKLQLEQQKEGMGKIKLTCEVLDI